VYCPRPLISITSWIELETAARSHRDPYVGRWLAETCITPQVCRSLQVPTTCAKQGKAMFVDLPITLLFSVLNPKVSTLRVLLVHCIATPLQKPIPQSWCGSYVLGRSRLIGQSFRSTPSTVVREKGIILMRHPAGSAYDLR
jgi:hypothetical protein